MIQNVKRLHMLPLSLTTFVTPLFPRLFIQPGAMFHDDGKTKLLQEAIVVSEHLAELPWGGDTSGSITRHRSA